ncbi:MAG: AAA family ATPase, partial [Phascolarctobacterium sp.]|nr:AAA family ATPase [Phascolarctobacterium sp.]
HTILPWHLFIGRIKDTVLEPACSVTTDKLSALELFMKDEIIKKLMKDGSDYYKLVRLQEFDDVIEKRVGKRLKAKPLSINADWRKLLDEEFDKGEKKVIDSDEELARIEKAAALNVLATSRISVLAGDAGTGKTTVLSVLCKHKEIAAGGILLMAPTGKATVRLKEAMSEKNISYEAMNVAQFLNKSKRYCAEDMRYTLSKIEGANEKETIIIDEASMLTEEMFGALMESIGKAKRIIFVGDPNQLTPIGSGCPFVDLVNLLRDKVTKNFPVVTDNYAELTINRRQADSEERLDVELAKTFTRNNLDSDKSIIAEIIKKPNDKIKFIRWTDRAELEDKLLEIIKDTAGMSSVDDVKGFDKFLGGTEKDGYMYFNLGAAKMIEKWQILAPVKNMPQGVININRLIHQKYRKNFIDLANKKGYQRRIPKALGSDGIVYGDKVINVINNGRDSYPKGLENYVANGEIGIACKCFYKRGSANYLNVEFSSKQGMTFSYDYRDFSEESGVDFLELAYALTVHKAQGSQFDTVILVLAEPCRIISRELIYTALSRQRANIVILYNDEPHKLMKYASNEYSDIARRFTDLFVGSRDKEHYPQVVEVNGKFYDENKIHRTARNEMVRSKSEVIIANSLDKHGIPYSYEKELILDGIRKVPDFTIEDGDAGEIWYWEHCGMMDVEKYRKNWESKKAFYAAHGIVEGENLIVTYEDGNGLDSYEIDKLVKSKFEDMIY